MTIVPNLVSKPPQDMNAKVPGVYGRRGGTAPNEMNMLMLASRAPASKSGQNGRAVTQPFS
eukprot:5422442-Heterocapsa_arctica.AAC.1